MSVTQYVGARYVPLFNEPLDWDITKEYEPLTIVYYAGNSYTSRQAVPKNIEITNEKFWALTGNYNAQVEQYRKEVRAQDARITSNANAIVTEKKRAEAAERANSDAITAIKSAATGYHIETGYDYGSLSHWKKFTLPRNVFNVDKLSFFLGSSSSVPDQNYAKYISGLGKKAIYFNGPMSGPLVSNGNILKSAAIGNEEYWYIIGIKPDGSINLIKDTSRVQTGSNLKNAYKHAFCTYEPIIVNGTKFDTAELPTSETNYNYIINKKHSRTVIAWDSDNIYFLIIEGRGYKNAGATHEEMFSLCSRLNFPNAVNLDGGHSCQAWSTNPVFNYVYLNSSNKNYGLSSGNIFALMEFEF